MFEHDSKAVQGRNKIWLRYKFMACSHHAYFTTIIIVDWESVSVCEPQEITCRCAFLSQSHIKAAGMFLNALMLCVNHTLEARSVGG